jgi:tRNA G18 (ribose-2'-O)-methylase SpoU
MGVSKIFLCGITPTPLSAGPRARNEISKTALGAEFYIPWEYCFQTSRLISKLKKEGVFIVALEQSKNAVRLDKFRIPKNKKIVALVVGNEIKGVSKKVQQMSNRILFIPMYGKKESLNVSVATGIALFWLRHQIER